jgi:hypothetical protein
MYESSRRWVITLLTLFPAAYFSAFFSTFFSTVLTAHEVTFDARICVCIGDLATDGKVDEDDVQVLLDCFDGECSLSFDDIEVGKECSDSLGCPADLNNNHLVGEGDLRVLLGHWGACQEPGDVDDDGDADLDDVMEVLDQQGLDCRADLDREGRVGGNDIAIAEAAWFGGDGAFARADVDGSGTLGILDLLKVIESMGQGCRADIDGNGTVECQDFDYACGFVPTGCGGLSCPALDP